MIAYYYFAGAIFVMSAAGIIISITQMRKVFHDYFHDYSSFFLTSNFTIRIKRSCEIPFTVMTSSMCAEEKEFMKLSEPKILFQEM